MLSLLACFAANDQQTSFGSLVALIAEEYYFCQPRLFLRPEPQQGGVRPAEVGPDLTYLIFGSCLYSSSMLGKYVG